MALGAAPASVVRLVLSRVSLLVGVGIVVGAGAQPVGVAVRVDAALRARAARSGDARRIRGRPRRRRRARRLAARASRVADRPGRRSCATRSTRCRGLAHPLFDGPASVLVATTALIAVWTCLASENAAFTRRREPPPFDIGPVQSDARTAASRTPSGIAADGYGPPRTVSSVSSITVPRTPRAHRRPSSGARVQSALLRCRSGCST